MEPSANTCLSVPEQSGFRVYVPEPGTDRKTKPLKFVLPTRTYLPCRRTFEMPTPLKGTGALLPGKTAVPLAATAYEPNP
jgi:hypothetical protein